MQAGAPSPKAPTDRVTRILVVGRFQPLHHGHASLLSAAQAACDQLVVALGSSNAPSGPRHPFDDAERTHMLRRIVPHAVIVPVTDLNDPPRWAKHCLDATGPVDAVWGHDASPLELFREVGMAVHRVPEIERHRYQGSIIRHQMAAGDNSWREAVPAEVAHYLDSIEAPKRLERLLGSG